MYSKSVLFDTIRMFTKIPSKESLPLINDVVIKFIFNITELHLFQNKFFKQNEWLHTSDPSSSLLANILKANLDNKIFNSNVQLTSCLGRYVDDDLACFMVVMMNWLIFLVSLIAYVQV